MTSPVANREPALLIAFVMAVLGVAASFGLSLTNAQLTGIYTLLMAGGAFWTRHVVYSPATIADARGAVKALAERARQKRREAPDA